MRLVVERGGVVFLGLICAGLCVFGSANLIQRSRLTVAGVVASREVRCRASNKSRCDTILQFVDGGRVTFEWSSGDVTHDFTNVRVGQHLRKERGDLGYALGCAFRPS